MAIFLPGLVSITLRKLSPEQILDLCAESGLQAIEWGGDIHVPPGDLETAQRVGFLTRARGLSVAAYGSYYRLGVSEESGLSFESVADTAAALGAPVIRVWAGNRESAQADDAWWDQVTTDARRIAAIARAREIRVAFEYHRHTLTDTRDAVRRLLAAVPEVNTLWQPTIGWPHPEHLASLPEVLPRLEHLHVFKWLTDGTRRPLAEGETEWREFLKILQPLDRPIPLLIEFVEQDNPENLRRDAAALCSWIR